MSNFLFLLWEILCFRKKTKFLDVIGLEKLLCTVSYSKVHVHYITISMKGFFSFRPIAKKILLTLFFWIFSWKSRFPAWNMLGTFKSIFSEVNSFFWCNLIYSPCPIFNSFLEKFYVFGKNLNFWMSLVWKNSRAQCHISWNTAEGCWMRLSYSNVRIQQVGEAEGGE